MTMPFGIFKGRSITEIESWYLSWLIDQDWMQQRFALLLRTIRAELAAREDDQTHDHRDGDMVVIPRVEFVRVFRRFAAKYHPDRETGNSAAMVAINTLRDDLLEVAGRAIA